ncbi:UPF0271 protein [Microbacterium saccharophilum]|uniref:UPF0271 protein n=2 Tax=Microbacteriaceae TaxID=85023 RepID=A0A7Z7D028_9MICO|nr:UPF0271 protein [Microbacterium saccharophilum]
MPGCRDRAEAPARRYRGGMAAIDLNADLGETVDGMPTADDEAMFEVVSSASVACGGHAGDAASMRDAVERAARRGVAVGAHPSYLDRAGFGRAAQDVDPATLRAQVAAQLTALVGAGADLRYVKAHGALYHAVTADAAAAAAVATAVADVAARLGRPLPVLGLDGAIARAAESRGLPFRREAFLDRGYRADGSLVPRGEPGALLHDPDAVAARAVRLVREGVVEAADGTLVRVDAVSLCVHGDTAGAVAMARAVRAALDAAGVAVRAPW